MRSLPLSGLPALLKWRVTRALRSAELLDEIVDSQLPLVVGLCDESRAREANYLAELVQLAGAYRAFARGEISRSELQRHGEATLVVLSEHRLSHVS
jgi:hypothetical protein